MSPVGSGRRFCSCIRSNTEGLPFSGAGYVEAHHGFPEVKVIHERNIDVAWTAWRKLPHVPNHP